MSEGSCSYITTNQSANNPVTMGTDEVDFARPSNETREEVRNVYPPGGYEGLAMEKNRQGLLNSHCMQQQKRKSCDQAESSDTADLWAEEDAMEWKRRKSEEMQRDAQRRMNECKVDGSDHMVVIAGPNCTINLNTSPSKMGTDCIDGSEPDSGTPILNTSDSSKPMSAGSVTDQSHSSKAPSMKKIFRYVSQRIPLYWKNVARELPMCEDDLIESEIHQLEEMYNKNLKEQAYNCFITWENSFPEECTQDKLITALRNCRLNLVIRDLLNQSWMRS